MRKILLIITYISVYVLTVNAQKRNLLKLNLISPLVKTLNMLFEGVIGEQKSFQIGFFYTSGKSEDESLYGFGITPEYRMYFSEGRDAPSGFFLAPFLRFQTFHSTVNDSWTYDEEIEASFIGIRPGLLIGHQWLFSDKVSFELFFGTTYSIYSIDIKSDEGEEDDFPFTDTFGIGEGNNFGIRAGLTIGIAL